MKKFLFLAFLLGIMSSCTKDSGLSQAGLQKIYTALNDGDIQAANERLAKVNQLTSNDLTSDGYTKELYGQVHLLETHKLGDAELIIYKLEKHERSRKIRGRLNSEAFKAKQAAGEVKSIDEENGIIVFSERKYAFKVLEDGEERYIIQPDVAALKAHFPENADRVQDFVQKHF